MCPESAAGKGPAMGVDQNAVHETTTRLDYRGVFGWPVRWHNGGQMLVTGSGIAAVAVPKSTPDPVLESVARQGCPGPALSMPTKHGMVVILLAEADILAPLEADLPPEVEGLTAGTAIPLPNERRPDNLA